MNPAAPLAPSAPALLPGGFTCRPSAGPATPATDSFRDALDQAVQGKSDAATSRTQTGKARRDSETDSDSSSGPREDRVKDQPEDEATVSDTSLAGALAVTAPPPPPPEDRVAPPQNNSSAELSIGTQDSAAGLWSAATKAGSDTRIASGDNSASTPPAPAPTGTTQLIDVLTPITPADVAPAVPLPATPQTPPVEETPVADFNLPTPTTSEAALRLDASQSVTANPTLETVLAEPLAAMPAAVKMTPGKVRLDSEDPADPGLRPAREIPPESADNPRGISTAKMVVAMKNTQKKDEIAGMTQQILPSVQPAQVPPLPGLNAAGLRREKTLSLGADMTALASEKISFAPVRTDASAPQEVSRSTTPALGRISELVTREVRLFKRAADDLVEVVLTPDAKTQISLRLQWREGQVEVQARCDTGDYRGLNGNWPQLQASLASQGVRLSHLSERVQTGLSDFFNQSSFSQSQGGERRASEPARFSDARATQESPRPAAITPRTTVRSNRLLESWA